MSCFLPPHILRHIAEHAEGELRERAYDTLEETAFLVDLLVKDERPVVFAAAQRPPRETDSDGPRNLLNAFRIASSPSVRAAGVLVTLNDDVNDMQQDGVNTTQVTQKRGRRWSAADAYLRPARRRRPVPTQACCLYAQ